MTKPELTTEDQLRRWQVALVAVGMMGALASMLGGRYQQRWLAISGLALLVLALLLIVVLGIFNWRRYG